ncbi:fumarate reductase (CoM/CoB) subunit TfrA [Methanococcus voltae]|uniref:Fumarate reductase/succinate dehydrogenase flavoprotein domain protein n=1 Tax=Methanococcus voltae (strain ATCC BAA-1334 / A3) TaxID=456320 RepID=D7DRD8_METV3|nr:fumarate reductase (CoM/CoB) subunit TfrA [Methanococcus voltae]MCS3901075.1 fumarate reductase (CoM/CoB) subunit A [Methanococcus voltae]
MRDEKISTKDNYVKTDILIIGGGGAAARACVEASSNAKTTEKDLNITIASKGLFGKSGCTVMAEGGYNAVLNSRDSCEKHYYDTMKGGAFINNSELVKILVENSPKELKNLEKFGCLFDRKNEKNEEYEEYEEYEEDSENNNNQYNSNNPYDRFKTAQRAFGGQSFNRTCYAGDRTGHEIMTGLMEYIGKLENVSIMEEVMALKLIIKENNKDDKNNNENKEIKNNNNNNKICIGAIFLNLITGEIFPIYAKSVILSTGGAGQIYPITSNPVQKVGDGFAMAYDAGLDLMDMEMVQFHPTGVVGKGTLVTEAVRGEGGILYNKNHERFMEKYDAKKMELSTRDVVAKAIYNEILNLDNGVNGGVYLDVSHLDNDVIEKKLETMFKQFMNLGVDIRKEPMLVAPTAHHFMGGIVINNNCKTSINGLFACGEIAGGIHGANRLGGNALADTQVFGAIAGENAVKYALNNETEREDENKLNKIIELELKKVNNEIKLKKECENNYEDEKLNYSKLINELKNIMWTYVSIVRNEKGLYKALAELDILVEKSKNLNVKGLYDVQKYFEFKNMALVSELVIKSALYRKESRGAHYREDYPETYDKCIGNIIINHNELKFIKKD